MTLIKRSTPRDIVFSKGMNPYAAGSVMAEFGKTKVHITAVIEDKVPPWMKGKGSGWVTAEYAMLPGSTQERVKRERRGASGRTQEIQRLIGRSLRAVVDMQKLGERQILIDCDVIVADGGTRTASISGSYVALKMAIDKLLSEGVLSESPIREPLAALSFGIDEEGKIITDLNYEEDSSCEADVNIIMTKSGKFVEIQGTAEGDPFSREQFDALLDCATESMNFVFTAQDKVLS